MTVIISIVSSYVLGILLGLVFPTTFGSAITVLVGAILLPFAAIKSNRIFALSVISCAFLAGWCRPVHTAIPTIEQVTLSPCPRIIQGEVLQEPTVIGKNTRLTIQLQAASTCLHSKTPGPVLPANGTVYTTVATSFSPLWKQGDKVRIRTNIEPLQQYKNVGDTTQTRKNISYRTFIANSDSVITTNGTGPRSWDNLRYRLGIFWTRVLGENSGRLARAMTLGQSDALTAEQKKFFRGTGTAHLLAVSGLHLGILAFGLYAVCSFVLVRIPVISNRIYVGRIAAVMTIPAIIGFTLLVGAKPPVVRACFMAVFVLVGKIINRRGDPENAIALAAATLLCIEPGDLKSPGFQLSFAAVIGLLATVRRNPYLNETYETEQPANTHLLGIKKRAILLLRVTVIAVGVTSPIALFHFGTVSLLAIPTNFVLVPFVSMLIMPLLLITQGIAIIFEPIGTLFAPPIQLALWTLEEILSWAAQFDATITANNPTQLWGFIFLCCFLCFICIGRYRLGMTTGFVGGVLLFVSLIRIPSHFPPQSLIVDFLDVGQGDTTLVTFPNGTHWLIDAGGTAHQNIGEGHIVPVLRTMGVKKIHTVVLTHPDPDHVAGIPAILNSFAVERIWDNGQGLDEGAHPAYLEMISIARHRNIPIQRGQKICGAHAVGPSQIHVLHPCFNENSYFPSFSFNDNSIVLHIAHKGSSVLLTGDLSVDGELALLDKKAPLDADILKLGHHGSSSSSSEEFLQAVNPTTCVASLSRWNRYHFPHASVLAGVQKQNAILYRTDIHGGVRAILKGRQTQLSTQKNAKIDFIPVALPSRVSYGTSATRHR